MDKSCPLLSEDVHPVSTNPQGINSTPNVGEHIKTFTGIRIFLCAGTGSSETAGSGRRQLMCYSMRRTPLPRLVSLSGQSSHQERRWSIFSMAPLPQPKRVIYEQSSATFSLIKSWGILAQHGLVMLSHTTERSCHKPLHSLEFEHT